MLHIHGQHFKSERITQSQQLKQNLIKQQNITFQVQTVKVTRKRVLNPHNGYIKTLKMYLMILSALKTHFHLQLKQDSKPYQAPLRCVIYALEKLFQDVLEKLQKQDIIAPLGVNETSEWCNSFVLVPKANGKVRLCLDPTCLNQALIRPIHRGPTLNDIFPMLNNVKYLSLIEASSEYHNLKLDVKSSYLTMFGFHFGQYRYKQLPFGAAPAGDMFQRKIDEILMTCKMYLASQMTF